MKTNTKLKYLSDSSLVKVGVGVKPKTDINVVVDWVDQDLVDMVLVMTVEPGFGGQSFMQESVKLIIKIKDFYLFNNVLVKGKLKLLF